MSNNLTRQRYFATSLSWFTVQKVPIFCSILILVWCIFLYSREEPMDTRSTGKGSLRLVNPKPNQLGYEVVL